MPFETKNKEIESLVVLLKGLTESYHTLISSAETFNRLSFSSKDDVEDAVDRADDLGDLIDDVLEMLKMQIRDCLNEYKR